MNKLLETTKEYPQTQIWNDSCSQSELQYCMENGGVGATTNPCIVLRVLKQELDQWQSTIKDIIKNNPYQDEEFIAWELIKAMGQNASTELLHLYNNSNGHYGRLSFQTNPIYFNNQKAIIEHAIELAQTIENAQIKAPTSMAGIQAFEELTYLGISINATVSFTTSQAMAVAQAVERGLTRRKQQGLSNDHINPVCTLMVGRMDDYLKIIKQQQQLTIDDEILDQAGIAIAKKVYHLYKKHHFKTKLLIAAFRNNNHWTQFIGGDLILTIPYDWQLKYNQSHETICNNINKPLDHKLIEKLQMIPEFNKAYDELGLSEEQFEHYGAFKITMEQFIDGYNELLSIIRKYMVN